MSNKQYWMLTVLLPNGYGHAHFANEVTDLSPMEWALKHYKVIINAIEITEKEYDKGMERALKKYHEEDPADQTGIICIETSKT